MSFGIILRSESGQEVWNTNIPAMRILKHGRYPYGNGPTFTIAGLGQAISQKRAFAYCDVDDGGIVLPNTPAQPTYSWTLVGDTITFPPNPYNTGFVAEYMIITWDGALGL